MTTDQLNLLRAKLVIIQSLGYRVSLNSQKETQPHKDGLQIMELADTVVEILLAVNGPMKGTA